MAHNFGALRRKSPPNPKPLDSEWIQTTEHANHTARQMLVGRLSSAQSHLHKEAIRTAYMALAEHDLKTGNTNEAMGSLNRASEYCTTRTQTAQLSLVTLQVAFCMGNFQYVREYSRRLELTMTGGGGGGGGTVADSASNSIVEEVKIKLQIAKAIERMVAGHYDSASHILIPLLMKGSSKTDSSNTSNPSGGGDGESAAGHLLDWPGVTSPEDLALYASLMCLVTQAKDRREMTALADHPEALELVPHMKEMLLQMSRAKYAQCMQAFSSGDGSWFPHLLPMGVDLYLTPPRLKKLAQQIREMCLVEYLKPFQCVKLESMQQLFPSLGDNLVDVLVDLMSRRLLPPTTRLDCRAGVLFQIPLNQNPTRQIQVMEEKMMDDAHAMLVRLACLESDLVVPDPNNNAGGPNTRGGQGRGRRSGRGGAYSSLVAEDAKDTSSGDEYDDDDDLHMGEDAEADT
ncbi:MAG: hypothetical protein SGILL_007295, partial [Bacillariaceae sp.]